MAHGAFGKNGEAFQIHSKVGAVPLLMTNQKSGSRFSIQPDTEFEEKEAIKGEFPKNCVTAYNPLTGE